MDVGLITEASRLAFGSDALIAEIGDGNVKSTEGSPWVKEHGVPTTTFKVGNRSYTLTVDRGWIEDHKKSVMSFSLKAGNAYDLTGDNIPNSVTSAMCHHIAEFMEDHLDMMSGRTYDGIGFVAKKEHDEDKRRENFFIRYVTNFSKKKGLGVEVGEPKVYEDKYYGEDEDVPLKRRWVVFPFAKAMNL